MLLFSFHHARWSQKLVAYLKYMTTVGVLLGGKEDEVRAQMKDVLQFEMQLAKVCISISDLFGAHEK